MNKYVILKTIDEAIQGIAMVSNIAEDKSNEISFITVGNGDSRHVVPIEIVRKGDNTFARFKSKNGDGKLYDISDKTRAKILAKINANINDEQVPLDDKTSSAPKSLRDPSLDIKNLSDLPEVELSSLATETNTPDGKMDNNEYWDRAAEIAEKMTSIQRDSVSNFTGDDYSAIKRYQKYDRHGGTVEGIIDGYDGYGYSIKQIEKFIEQGRVIQSMFDTLPKMPGVVFRGMYFFSIVREKMIDSFMQKEYIEFDSISSTSRSCVEALEFSGGDLNGAVLLKLNQKNAIPVETISGHPSEKELIMKAGTKFRVLKRMKTSQGGLVIEAEEID